MAAFVKGYTFPAAKGSLDTNETQLHVTHFLPRAMSTPCSATLSFHLVDSAIVSVIDGVKE